MRRRVLPSLQGPEVERMMAMLVEDIALFVESTTSHIFATKEHGLLDLPLLSGEVPALFHAD
ncbi:MAG: hypothetical protein ACPHUF_06680 [Gammaproteobacteria bacterium]